MRGKRILLCGMAAVAFLLLSIGWSVHPREGIAGNILRIVTSDTILSGMIASLLPPQRYAVEAILPPGQCPGHYDVKISDIEKAKKADLTVSFKGMPFMKKVGQGGEKNILLDPGDHNWMAPDSYRYGLNLLAEKLSKQFPEDANEISRRRQEAVRKVDETANALIAGIKQRGIHGKSVIASSMQKESLEWMGFRVVAEYGRPEAISAREIVRLAKAGEEQRAAAVVDNLQSGPDTGKGIAEALGIPHVVLTNFPSDKGYLATLEENVRTLAAVMKK
jgi:zinc transport system substrate-binding protein